jgi:hypothetical protein
MSLEDDFTNSLEGTIVAAKKRGYVPTYFMQMLAEHGSVKTAKRLLAKPEIQQGLMELWQLNLLNESMEAIIWDNPRFHTFFESTEIDEAHRRLEELGYFKKG